jgi:hypothetical protein
MRVRYAYGIYDPDGALVHVDINGENERDAWFIYCGWPDDEEIESRKKSGYKCVRVAVAPL